ncbi:MAG TPA: inositol monophosphatase [Paenibacillaceae bacterium]|nr:inositol monophosphatase [Paenibacillaceae bacterium]
MTRTLTQWGQKAKQWALDAGRLSVERLRSPFAIEYKTSPSDLVTQVDQEVERYLVDTILRTYPDHGILGEEGTFTKDIAEFDTLWIIDPIDGTTNFVHQQQNFVISMGVYHKGAVTAGVVYDPIRDELFYAEKGGGAYLNGVPLHLRGEKALQESLLASSTFWNETAMRTGMDKKIQQLARYSRGMRIFGCAALELAYVAAGRIDGYMSVTLNPWDFAAGNLLVEEAGGKVTRSNGEKIDPLERGSILASHSSIHQEFIDFIN